MNKITNVQALATAISTLRDIEGMMDVVVKLTNIKNSYEYRSAHKHNKPTKVQQANIELKARIIDLMVDGEQYRVDDIVKALDNEYTSQKISALMTALKENGDIRREVVKGKALYTRVAS